MTKILKIFIIFTIILNFQIYISNAETTNLYNDINSEQITETSDEEDIDQTKSENISSNEDIDSLSVDSSYTNYPSFTTENVSAVSSIAEANLGLNNILCIILIAIGILIILLAIAILIRLK